MKEAEWSGPGLVGEAREAGVRNYDPTREIRSSNVPGRLYAPAHRIDTARPNQIREPLAPFLHPSPCHICPTLTSPILSPVEEDVEQLVRDAWKRIRPALFADADELTRRLARRRKPLLQKPPRAWCLAVRANDTRINEATAAIVPECALYPRLNHGHHGRHEVTLTAPLLEELCQKRGVCSPGEAWWHVAKRLGHTLSTLQTARSKMLFGARYRQGLEGRRGKPTPVLFTTRRLDPSSPLFALPDPAWGKSLTYRIEMIPRDLEQTIERVPAYRAAVADLNADSEPPLRRPAPRVPKPEPDYLAWYKWSKNNEYLGDDPKYWRKSPQDPGTPPSPEEPRQFPDPPVHFSGSTEHHVPDRKPRPSRSSGSILFAGWRWLCPGCARLVRTIYYPLPPINLLAGETRRLLQKLPRTRDLDAEPQPMPCFACCRCHRIRYFSRLGKDSWNELIAYLTGGLLYGREVPRPDWLTPDRKRAYRPCLTRAPSKRREEVLARLLKGWTYDQIAADLGVGFATVSGHATTIYKQHEVAGRNRLAKKLGVALPARHHTRTPARREKVRHLLAAGKPYKEIAAALGVSYHVIHHDVRIIRRERRADTIKTADVRR
jgi:DNA-binding CsgD family transcriptional regulator